jgi:hypothetical protein
MEKYFRNRWHRVVTRKILLEGAMGGIGGNVKLITNAYTVK